MSYGSIAASLLVSFVVRTPAFDGLTSNTAENESSGVIAL